MILVYLLAALGTLVLGGFLSIAARRLYLKAVDRRAAQLMLRDLTSLEIRRELEQRGLTVLEDSNNPFR